MKKRSPLSDKERDRTILHAEAKAIFLVHYYETWKKYYKTPYGGTGHYSSSEESTLLDFVDSIIDE